MHAVQITLKDLRLLTRDRRALIVLLALPLVLISVIGASGPKVFSPPADPKDTEYIEATADKSASVEASGSETDSVPDGAASDPAETPSKKPDVSSQSRVYRAIIPGFIVLFVFFLVNIMGRSFIQERDLGTLQRIRIAPVSATSIMAGKTLPFLLVSVVQTALLLLAGVFLFGMDAGSRPWLLIPLVLCTSLAATTLGLAFAAFARTDAQVSAWGNLIVLATAGISGCLVPRHLMPDTSQQLSLVTPHAWSLVAYREILVPDHPSTGLVLGCCGMLLVFSAIFSGIGLLGFRRA